MSQPDPRVDAYIARSAAFAQPILEHLRGVVHRACPQAEETLKWGTPSFMYGGKILCGMAAFKQHATFGFWQGARLIGADGNGAKAAGPDPGKADAAMGQFGRLTTVADLPGKRVLAGYVKQAMALIDAGVVRPATREATPKPPVAVPEDLAAALKADAKARATFEAFPPSQRREYVDWLTDAKRDETRQRRLEQAVEWLAEGKPRHWKYINC